MVKSILKSLKSPFKKRLNVETELLKCHQSMSLKQAKKEANTTRRILGHGASAEEVLRATNERFGKRSPAPKPVEEPVKEERQLETAKEEEVITPALEPVKEERELEIKEEEEEEEEPVEGFETDSPVPEQVDEPMEENRDLEKEDDPDILPGLTRGDINRTYTDTHNYCVARLTCW
jgi:hypothetical protein